MTFIPFSDGIEVVFNFRIGGQTVKNILNFVHDSTPDATVLTNLAKALIDAWLASSWWTGMGNGVTLESVKATSMVSASAPTVTVTSTATNTLPITKTAAVGPVPNNVALVVTQRTGNRGRSYRGRTYLAGIKQDNMASTVEAQSAVVTWALALMADLVAASSPIGSVMSVFSRQHGGVPLTTGVATPITSSACNPAIDSQRRRLEGRGS